MLSELRGLKICRQTAKTRQPSAVLNLRRILTRPSITFCLSTLFKKLSNNSTMSSNNEKSVILDNLKSHIGSYADFPKKGVIFRDIFPILQNPKCFADLIYLFEDYVRENASDVQGIIGIESRGFLLGSALALRMTLPFIPLRKPGKLPGEVIKEAYSLEYGSDALEIQQNSIEKGKTYVIIDDLLATGGTMLAAVNLIRKLGGTVGGCLIAIELNELRGGEKIPATIYSLMQY